MRTRITTSDPCPTITTRDFAWDTSVTPWKRQYSTRTTYSPNVLHLVPNGFYQKIESITDEVGVDGRFRPCTHTLQTNVFDDADVLLRYPASCCGNTHALLTSVSRVNGALALTTAPSVNMDEMAFEALAYMLPHLNEGNSLVNSVLEMKDLKSWLKAGHAVARIKGKYLDHNGRLTSRPNGKYLPYSDLSFRLKGGRTKMFKDIALRLTGAHLEASFGIVPFVRDVVGALSSLEALSYKIELLKKFAGKPQVRHYRRFIPKSDGVPEDREWKETSTNIDWPTQTRFDRWSGTKRPTVDIVQRSRWIKRPVYTATARYIYSVPKLGEVEERIRTSLDTLGVNLDPSIIWNAIPFSFVLDWIVDISGFLQSFARDNFPIEVKLSDFCHSMAWHSESTLHTVYPKSDTISGGYDVVLPVLMPPIQVSLYRGVRSSFSRVPVRPDIHVATTRRLRLKQAALAGSLLLQTALGGKGRTISH